MNTEFKFNELIWVSPQGFSQPGEWALEERKHIHLIRDLHPEIEFWGDLAIGLAFGSYSQNLLEVSWADWIRKRELEFLGYIYIAQKSPGFNFRGVMDSQLTSYSDTLPWVSNLELPDWAIECINQKLLNQRSMENNQFINDIGLIGNNLTLSDEQHEAINTLLNSLPASADFKDKLSSCFTENALKLGLSQKYVDALKPLQTIFKKGISESTINE